MTNISKRILKLRDIATSRLEYPYLPKFEEQRLKSILNPITKEEAIELWKESSWVANFACIVTEENKLKLLSFDDTLDKYNYFTANESIWNIIWFNSKWKAYEVLSDSDILNLDIIFFYVD